MTPVRSVGSARLSVVDHHYSFFLLSGVPSHGNDAWNLVVVNKLSKTAPPAVLTVD